MCTKAIELYAILSMFIWLYTFLRFVVLHYIYMYYNGIVIIYMYIDMAITNLSHLKCDQCVGVRAQVTTLLSTTILTHTLLWYFSRSI